MEKPMVLDLLRKRCSVKKFSAMPISEKILLDILEAGRLSPSGGNEQPWKFGVVTDREQIKLISEAAYNQTWICSAPLLIVLCCTIVSDDRSARAIQKKRFPRRQKEIDKMDKELYSWLNVEEHQTKIPGTHMVLQALEYGIYSNWISYFDVENVSKILRLPNLYVPSEIIAFGYPLSEVYPKTKKRLEEIVFYNSFL